MTELILPSLQQWLLLSGVAVAVGCAAWGAVVGPRASRIIAATDMKELQRIERDVAAAGAIAALALVGVWALRMGVQVMMFRDPFVPLWEDVSFLLFETFWGTVWMVQGALLPPLVAAFWVARGRPAAAQAAASETLAGSPGARTAWLAASALVLLLVTTLALSSHAMSAETARPLIVAADGVHALAAGSWIGSLGLILTVGRPAGGGGEANRVFAAQLRSFSPMAVASVSALVVMGVIVAWTHLHTLTNLWTTAYGRILSAKIGVACAVFALGLWNWRKGLASADTPDGQAAVRRRAVWELSLASGVLVLTAVLVNTAKP